MHLAKPQAHSGNACEYAAGHRQQRDRQCAHRAKGKTEQQHHHCRAGCGEAFDFGLDRRARQHAEGARSGEHQLQPLGSMRFEPMPHQRHRTFQRIDVGAVGARGGDHHRARRTARDPDAALGARAVGAAERLEQAQRFAGRVAQQNGFHDRAGRCAQQRQCIGQALAQAVAAEALRCDHGAEQVTVGEQGFAHVVPGFPVAIEHRFEPAAGAQAARPFARRCSACPCVTAFDADQHQARCAAAAQLLEQQGLFGRRARGQKRRQVGHVVRARGDECGR